MYARSVLVVEDDALVRSLIASHLETAGFQVAVAANFTDALRLMKIIDPDGLILDIDLGPGPNGFDLAERIRRQSDEVAILFLTSLSDPRFANSKLDKSASSTTYLNKHLVTDASSLLSALEAALTDTNVEAHRDDLRTDRPLGNLSKLQIQILQLVAQGKTNQQIAVLRGRSIAATESAVSRTLKALGIDVSEDINARVVAANEYMLKIKPLARRSDA